MAHTVHFAEDQVVVTPRRGASKVRYLVLGLCFLGLTMNYLDRANLSVALPYMDKDLHLNLSNTEKGLILGAFFWAYDGLMLVAGWFTDKIGSRRAFSFAAIWWSLFTMLTPMATSFAGLFGVRFLLGAGEAPAYPSSTKAASRWFPQTERAFATAVIDSGLCVGTVAALPIVTALIAVSSWHYSFVILGFWDLYGPPCGFGSTGIRENSGANDLERKYIVDNGGRTSRNDDPAAVNIRWIALFRYRTIRGMMFGFFA